MIGTKIGSYRVLKVLGEGGMGRVVLAEHALMKTRHAVKILHEQLSKTETIVQRFINEARAAGAIGHRNVVEITHIDQLEAGGCWYLVMKYLEGRTLADLLDSRSDPLDQRTILHITAEALNGLQAAHNHRIIHRDLKPDNLYLTTAKDDPYRTILLDFGVAQLGHDAGVVTKTGSLIGTPQYMAPEQHRGGHVDERTDLWAMGAMVYEMVTARLPFQDDGADRGSLTGAEIFYRMMSRPIVDPRRYNPSVTPEFARAILMALHIDPSKRPPSPRAFAQMLASATPRDAHGPSGTEILRAHADELLEEDIATVPIQRPTLISVTPIWGPDPAPGYTDAALPDAAAARAAAPTAPMSTLGDTASQSLPAAPRLRASWRLLAVGLPIVVAVAIGVVLLGGHDAPRATLSRNETSDSADGEAAARSPTQAPAKVVATAQDDVATDAGGGAAATPAPRTPDATVAASAAPAAQQRSTATTATGADAGVSNAPATAEATPEARLPGRSTTAAANAAQPPVKSREVVAPDAARAVAKSSAAATAAPLSPGKARDAGPEPASKVAFAAPMATGSLKIVILPWAEVWIDGKPIGQTPLRTTLPAGPHRVRLKNDVKEKTINVNVTPSRLTVIDETW